MRDKRLVLDENGIHKYCEYCETNPNYQKPLYEWNTDDPQDFAQVWIEKEKLNIQVDAYGQTACDVSIPISCCPKCGRKLNENTKNE